MVIAAIYSTRNNNNFKRCHMFTMLITTRHRNVPSDRTITIRCL